MAWFTRARRSRFPADMMRRMERFGRYSFDPLNNGVDDARIWDDCVIPFLEDSKSDRNAFLGDLWALVAGDRSGFATWGAARLVWELFGGDCIRIPAALPLIDAGIEFKVARGLAMFHLTGYEQDRVRQLRNQDRPS